MKKSHLISILSSILGALIILTLVLIFVSNRDNSQNNTLDINHVYEISDFPSINPADEGYQNLVKKLNTDYGWLRDNVDYSHYDIWIDIGNTKYALEDYDGAVAAWQQAIKLNDVSQLAYANLANYYKSHVHDYEKSQYYYDLVVQKDTVGYFQDYLAYADLYINYLPKDVAKVEIIMLTGADKASYQDKFDFYKFLHDFFEEQGDTIKAENYKTKALEIRPDFQF